MAMPAAASRKYFCIFSPLVGWGAPRTGRAGDGFMNSINGGSQRKTVAWPTQMNRCCSAAKRTKRPHANARPSDFHDRSNALSAHDLLEIDLEARTHRRRHRNLLHELALGARWLGLDDRIHERPEILLEVGFGEAGLADPGVDD